MSNIYDPNHISRKVFARVGQKAIILDEENRILMMKRSDKTEAAGKWSLPGGALELNEDPTQGIKREVEEETGLIVDDLKLFDARSRTSPDNDFVVVLCYVGKADSTQVQLNWEHTDFQWVAVEDALKLDLSPDPRYFLTQFSR
jgi:8-oxo-dGTP diphosphatase